VAVAGIERSLQGSASSLIVLCLELSHAQLDLEIGVIRIPYDFLPEARNID